MYESGVATRNDSGWELAGPNLQRVDNSSGEPDSVRLLLDRRLPSPVLQEDLVALQWSWVAY